MASRDTPRSPHYAAPMLRRTRIRPSLRPPVAALLALATLLPTAALAQRPSRADRWQSVRDTANALIVRDGIPSIAVAVAQGGRIIWEEGFGLADREKLMPATAHTLYSLASITKPMTATALMMLVEQGKIDLDKPANDYLGTGKITGLAGDAREATVRRVLAHTAGLPLHYQFYFQDQAYPVLSNDETIARYAIVTNPPGEMWEYSNLGYGILDHIIARVSGMDYADFMRARVFAPLGLPRTSVGIGPGLEPYVAQRYDRQQRRLPFYDFDHRGASAVYASAHDLVRFGMFHLKDRLPGQRSILRDSTIDLMQRPVAPAGALGSYALGWIVAEREGKRVVYHSGGMPGVQTLLLLYPDEDAAVVVLMNTVGDVGKVSREIERVLLPSYADARARSERAARERAAAAAAAAFVPPQPIIGEWAGTLRTWDRTVPMTLSIRADGDIHVRLGERGLEAVLNQPRWENETLIGRFAGTIPTADATRWPHEIVLSLRLHGEKLDGMAAAMTMTDPVYFALTSYVALTRKAPAGPTGARGAVPPN